MAEVGLKFQKFLLQLSDDLKPKDVKKLKFLVDFEERKTSSMSEAFEIFGSMQEENQLSPTNLTALKGLLNDIGRPDLVSRVRDKEDYFAQLELDSRERQTQQPTESENQHSKDNAPHITGEITTVFQSGPPFTSRDGSMEAASEITASSAGNVPTSPTPTSPTPTSPTPTSPIPTSPTPTSPTTGQHPKGGDAGSSLPAIDFSKVPLENLAGLATLLASQQKGPSVGVRPTGPHSMGTQPLGAHTMGPHMMRTGPMGMFGDIGGPMFYGAPHMGYMSPPRHYRPLPKEEYYEKDGYQVKIENALRFGEKSDEVGVVEIKSGTEFKIKVRNNNEYGAEVDIDFDHHYLGIWVVESKASKTITGSSYEPGNLVFNGKHPSQPGSDQKLAPESLIRFTFSPDATPLYMRWPNGPEERMNFQRTASVGDIFFAFNRRLKKAGKDVEVRGLVKLQGEWIMLDEDKLTWIEECGLKFDDKVVALTPKENLYIQMPDGSELVMELDPIHTGIPQIRSFVGKTVNAKGKRVKLWLKGIALDDEKKRELVLHFAETDHPLLIAEIAPELTIKLIGGKLKKGEELEMKVHPFMKIRELHDYLNSDVKLITWHTGKLILNGNRMKHASMFQTLGDANVQDGDVIIMKEIPKPERRRSFEERIEDGYEDYLNHIEDRSLDMFTDLREADKRFGNLVKRGIDDIFKRRYRSSQNEQRYSPFDSLLFGARRPNYNRKYDQDRPRKFEKSLQKTLILKLRHSNE